MDLLHILQYKYQGSIDLRDNLLTELKMLMRANQTHPDIGYALCIDIKNGVRTITYPGLEQVELSLMMIC